MDNVVKQVHQLKSMLLSKPSTPVFRTAIRQEFLVPTKLFNQSTTQTIY